MTSTDTTEPTDTTTGPRPFDELGDELDVFDDVVDPRLRARWVEARRAEGRRRLYVICAVVGTLAVGVIAYVIAHSSLLGAGTVQVHGVPATAASEIRAAARIPDGSPLLFLDEGAIARRVEALPTVARAQVSTELPSTVVIRVTERVPLTPRPNDHNLTYLRTKRDRMGHVLPGLTPLVEPVETTAGGAS